MLAGESCRSVVERFGVAVSSVVKWSQRHRRTGSVAPGKMGGHRKPVLDPHRDFIVRRIEVVPHLTLHRLKGELAQRGVKVPHGTSWTFMRRQGLRLLPLNRPVPTSGLGGNSGVPASQIWTPCVAGGP